MSSLAFAQGSAVITGIVTDAATGKPVPDVVITATSPSSQGEEVIVTDSAGSYRLAQLPSGTYTLKLEKESYKPFTRSEVTIRTDRTVRVNIQLQPEAVTGDTVVVVGKPPTVDVGSTTSGINVGSEFINNIAFIRPTDNGIRSFESLASVAPQVASDTYGFGFSGASSAENQIFLDGVNVNDAQTGVNGAQLPVDFIKEANIITGGYMAEYGRAGGGVINAVTKSGSNEFHGSVWGTYTPGLLSPPSPEIPTVGSSSVTQTRLWNIADFGAEVGGPILKDKLWFYVGISPSFNRQRNTRRLNKYIVGVEDGKEVYERNEDGSLQTSPIEGYEQRRFDDRRSISYIAKLTYLINSDNNVELSVNGSNQDRNIPIQFTNRIGGIRYDESNLAVSLKYAGAFLDKSVLVDVTGGWFHQTATPTGLPTDGSTFGSTTGAAGTPSLRLRQVGPPLALSDVENLPENVLAQCDPGSFSLTPCPATGAGITYTRGGFGAMQRNVNDRFTGRASVTVLARFLGHHIIKGGLDVEHSRYDTTKSYSGGVTIQQATNGATYLDFRRYAALSSPDKLVDIPIVNVTPTTNMFGFYLQDQWSIADVITLNAGLRYDTQVLYNATGALGMALNNMYSPRVGLIYDFTQQGRSKVFANYARYYQGIPLNLADRALSGENQAGFNRGRGCNPFSDPNLFNTGACLESANYISNGSTNSPSRFARVTGQGRTPIDPDLQAQGKDELSFGGEYEVISDLRVGATYTKSWMQNIIEDMSNDEANTYFIGNPGLGLAKDFPRATRDYDAVTLMATKAFSDGWMGQFSYTWSSLRGNWAGFFRPETGQLDPGTLSDFDLKSLLGNRTGPLPGDRTHFIKGYVSKNFQVSNAFSVLLGVTYEGSSGTPISYLGNHPLYGAGEAFILPRGAAGRTPWLHVFNLKAGVGYRLSKDSRVEFTVDVLNLFNSAAVTNVDQDYTNESVLPYTPEAGENANEAVCAAGPNVGSNCVTKVTVVDENGAALDDKLNSSQINKNFKRAEAYQLPLQFRFGVKFTF
jgi:outer membrane receptor protein involved in Fe transport